MSIIDQLMKPSAKPQILSGGPNQDGQWIVVVEYLSSELVLLRAELSLRELQDWRKRRE